MIWIFIGFGVATLIAYSWYSRGERSYLNAMTVATALKLIVEFGLEPISYEIGIFDYRPSTFLQIYLASYLAYIGMLVGAKRNISIIDQRRKFSPIVGDLIPWVFLAGSFLLYVPIFIEFRDHILDPRYIYEQTRTGYGLQYFGSGLLMNCSLVLYLLSARRFHAIYIFSFLLVALSKGSKGQVLVGLMIYIIWAVYVLGRRFSLARTLVGASVAVGAMGLLFALNYRGEIESLVLTVAGYSDYNRNASLIIEDPKPEVYWGRLSFENVVYSKVPRAIWPSKPKNFGSFYLAEEYFPRLFEMDQGAPSFGIGTYFADFGTFAYVVVFLVNYLSGILLRYFAQRCDRSPSVMSFMMLLFFSDVVLIQAGVGYFVVETFILAILLELIVRGSPKFVRGGV